MHKYIKSKQEVLDSLAFNNSLYILVVYLEGREVRLSYHYNFRTVDDYYTSFTVYLWLYHMISPGMLAEDKMSSYVLRVNEHVLDVVAVDAIGKYTEEVYNSFNLSW